MYKIRLTTGQFKALNAAIKSSIAVNDGRENLNYAKVEVDSNGDITAVALDGHQITVYRLKTETPMPEPFEFYYKPVALPARTKGIELECDPEKRTCRVSFYNEGLISSVEIPPLTSDYPLWKKIMEGFSGEAAILVDPKKIAKALQAHSNAPYVELRLKPKGGWVDGSEPLIIHSKTGESDTLTAILPQRKR